MPPACGPATVPLKSQSGWCARGGAVSATRAAGVLSICWSVAPPAVRMRTVTQSPACSSADEPMCGTPCPQIRKRVPPSTANTWFWLAPISARSAGRFPVSIWTESEVAFGPGAESTSPLKL